MIMEINTSISSSSSTTPKPHHHHHPSPPSTGLPPSLIPISRSEPNTPYPTTFVQADTSSFKQVVQMLTGSSEPTSPTPDPPPPKSSSFAIPPIKTNHPKRGGGGNSFKLYERRNNPNLNHALIINTLLPNAHFNYPPRNSEILSPTMLDFPNLLLSPVTPLNEDPFNKTEMAGNSSPEEEEEQRAIAHKGFYLHPSPMSTPRDSEPQLLPLFPLTSPRLPHPHPHSQIN